MTLPQDDRPEHRDTELDFEVLTPLFAQYFGLKQEHSGCLMLMRVGDFYEAYGDDAMTVARDAEIVLTAKEAGGGRKVPMSGVPFFALDNYLRLLVTAGHRRANGGGAFLQRPGATRSDPDGDRRNHLGSRPLR